MAPTTCPGCGAAMETTTVGALHDKVLRCPYCGHQVDLPDEVTIRKVERADPYTDADGRTVSRHSEVVITRRDLGSGAPADGDPFAQLDVDGLLRDGSFDGDLDALFEAVREAAGDDAAREVAQVMKGAGASAQQRAFTHTTTTTHHAATPGMGTRRSQKTVIILALAVFVATACMGLVTALLMVSARAPQG